MSHFYKEKMDSDKEYNVIFLGNVGTGKSSIIQRRVNGDFSEVHNQTVGFDFKKITETVVDKQVRLNLVDTAGQETYRSVASNYYHKADICLFVADVTNRDSFRDLADWKSNLENVNNDAQHILVINKIDMMPELSSNVEENNDRNDSSQLVVEKNDFINEIKSIIREYPNRFWVSAKSGEGINDVFNRAAFLALNGQPINSSTQITENIDGKKNCC